MTNKKMTMGLIVGNRLFLDRRLFWPHTRPCRWGTDDPLKTFGGAGVVEIPQMQKLLHFICEQGFEHHVAANFSTVAAAVHEATTRYYAWEMYWQGQAQC